VNVGVSVVCRHVGCARLGALEVCRRPICASDLFFFSSAHILKSLSSSLGPFLDIYTYIHIYDSSAPSVRASGIRGRKTPIQRPRFRGTSSLRFTCWRSSRRRSLLSCSHSLKYDFCSQNYIVFVNGLVWMSIVTHFSTRQSFLPQSWVYIPESTQEILALKSFLKLLFFPPICLPYKILPLWIVWCIISCVCVCVCVCVCFYVYIIMSMSIHVCVLVWMYLYSHVYMCISICTHDYVQFCVRVCLCIQTSNLLHCVCTFLLQPSFFYTALISSLLRWADVILYVYLCVPYMFHVLCSNHTSVLTGRFVWLYIQEATLPLP